jgi:hypothetical protein
MASKLFPALLLAVVVWLGFQIWRDSSEGLRKTAEDGSPKIVLAPASARPDAADFTLNNAAGAPVQLASYEGKSPVIVKFFTTY